MSMEKQVSVNCPNCKTKISLTMWETLNASLNPEVAERLIQGGFFNVTCSRCHFVTQVVYPLLYHDTDNNTMVQYVPISSDPESASQLEDYRRTFKEAMSFGVMGRLASMRPKFRIVTNANDLQEKAIILRAGLDDCVIEIIKAIKLAKAQQARRVLMLERARYFVDKAGKQWILFFDYHDNEKLSTPFDMKEYEYLKQILPLNDISDDIIDLRWAQRFIQKSRK